MSLGKKGITSNISSETSLDKATSKSILESFIKVIKSNRFKNIKISNFGTFVNHTSPQRVGRNPKTKEEYPIPKRKKLTFKASSFLKINLN